MLARRGTTERMTAAQVIVYLVRNSKSFDSHFEKLIHFNEVSTGLYGKQTETTPSTLCFRPGRSEEVMEMRISARRWTSVLVTNLMLVWGAAANAQQPASRGSVKVEPRFFNPFDVGVSSLQLNAFGSFEIKPSTASPLGSIAAASAAPTSMSGNQAGVPVGPVRRPITPPPFRSPFMPGRPPFDPPGPPFDPPGPPSDRPPFDPPGRP